MRWIAVIALGFAACESQPALVSDDGPDSPPRHESVFSDLDDEPPRARIDVLEKLPETDTPLPKTNPLLCLGRSAGGQLALETEAREAQGGDVWHVFADVDRRGATLDAEYDRLLPADLRDRPNERTAKAAAGHGRIDREQLDDLVERLGTALLDAPTQHSNLSRRGVVRVQWRCDASAPWNELRVGYQDFGGGSPELALHAAVGRIAHAVPLRSAVSAEDDEPFDVRRLRK